MGTPSPLPPPNGAEETSNSRITPSPDEGELGWLVNKYSRNHFLRAQKIREDEDKRKVRLGLHGLGSEVVVRADLRGRPGGGA